MIDIRDLTPADNDDYRRLWLHGITEHSSFFRIAADDDAAPNLPTHCTIDSFTLGAFADKQLVGIVSLQRDLLTKLQHKALIYRMFVHPQAAGHGVGRTLLVRLIDTVAAHSDIRQIHLTVLATNARAIHLYQSLGFVTFAREIASVRIDDHYVDELQMARFVL